MGERRFLGLYTSTAYSARPDEIPLLRRKVRKVRERSGLPPGSHDDKALIEILETYPRDELFQISDDELFEIAMGILRLGERPRVRLFVRRTGSGGSCPASCSCLATASTRRSGRVQDVLQEAFNGKLRLLQRPPVRVRAGAAPLRDPHQADQEVPDYDVREIEARLVEVTRSWVDDLLAALVEQLGEEQGQALRRYRDAFPAAYRDDFTPAAAVLDIQRMERLDPAGDLELALYRPLEAADDFSS